MKNSLIFLSLFHLRFYFSIVVLFFLL